jgi:hypothetical protein
MPHCRQRSAAIVSRAPSCGPPAPAVQVYEDSPQEMRSRLWYVLLNRPHLIEPLQVGGSSSGAGQQQWSTATGGPVQMHQLQGQHRRPQL